MATEIEEQLIIPIGDQGGKAEARSPKPPLREGCCLRKTTKERIPRRKFNAILVFPGVVDGGSGVLAARPQPNNATTVFC